MTAFAKWWDSDDNPCKNMPGAVKEQMKPFMRQAFAGGARSERNKRVVRDKEIIEARNMFKGVPEI